jgi:hypothetical protein
VKRIYPYIVWTIVLGAAFVGGLYVANALVEAFAAWATRFFGG